MSADNGVYILKFKDTCRVKEVKGIESLFTSSDNPIPPRIYREFKDAQSAPDMNGAIDIAAKIYKDLSYCEKGIVTIIIDKTWNYYKRNYESTHKANKQHRRVNNLHQ